MSRQNPLSTFKSRSRRNPVGPYRSRRSGPLFERLEDRLALAVLNYSVPAGNGTDNLTLLLAGPQVLLFDNGVPVANLPLAQTTAVAITGAANENDALTIDFSGGLLPLGIQFNGGAAGSDSLRILGGTFTTVLYTAAGQQTGTVQLDTLLIKYTNLEDFDADTSAATNRVFTSGISGAQSIRLTDDRTPANNMSTVDSNGTGAFLGIDFKNPTTSLTVNAGNGDDAVTALGLDSNLNATVTLNGESGNDTLAGNARDNRLSGGPGNDTLIGGAGNDTYLFDADAALGIDTLNEAGGGIDTLDFAATTTLDVIVGLAGGSVQTVNGNLSLSLTASNTFENAIGGALNDTLTGNGLDNRLTGGPGNDTLTGGPGNDTLTGGAGNDTYLFDADAALGIDTLNEAGGGTDTLNFLATSTRRVTVDLSQPSSQFVASGFTLTLLSGTTFENVIGGSFGDLLTGNALDNTLIGGPGDDVLIGGAGNDTYPFDADRALGEDRLIEADGGGIDTLDFSQTSTQGVEVDLGDELEQAINVILNLTISADTFENVIGGSQDDYLDGNHLDNTLTGGPGDDRLIGRRGNDTYLFDADLALGADFIDESDGGGIDTLDFAATTTLGVQVELGLGGLLHENAVNANLKLRLDFNTIENLIGGSQDDVLYGNGLDNRLIGGPGNDQLLFADSGNDILTGGPGDDRLAGGSGNDTYLFNADGTLGSDVLDDFTGIDTLDFTATTTLGVTVDLADTEPQIINGNLTLELRLNANIENVLGGALNDTLTGNSLDNTLTGATGNDTLIGGAGNDTYLFDADEAFGSDTLDEAGGGIDTLDFAATVTRDVAVNLSSTSIQSVASTNRNLRLLSATTFENVIGGALNDTLTGNALNNRLAGRTGNDNLVGNDGADTLLGEGGNDLLTPGNGPDDVLDGGPDQDGIAFYGTPGNDRIRVSWQAGPQAVVRMNGQTFVYDYANGETIFVFAGAGNDDVVMEESAGLRWRAEFHGQAGHDHLVGSLMDDLLIGGMGRDYLQGGQSNDRLDGGAGLDFFDGGAGVDSIFADDDALDVIFADDFDLLVDVDPFDLVLGRRRHLNLSFLEHWLDSEPLTGQADRSA